MQQGHARHKQYQREQKREWLKLRKDLENGIISDDIDLNYVGSIAHEFRLSRDSILDNSPTIAKEKWINEPVGNSVVGWANSSRRGVTSVHDRRIYKKL